MANAVINSSGTLFYSKVVDPNVTPANNVLIKTSTVSDPPSADNSWDSIVETTNILGYSVQTSASEAGPVKNTYVLKTKILAAATTASSLLAKGIKTAATSLSGYAAVSFYIRCTRVSAETTLVGSVPAGTLELRLYSDNAWSTVKETLPLPAIPITVSTSATDIVVSSTEHDVSQWKRIVLKLADPENESILSVGLYGAADLTNDAVFYIEISDIILLKQMPGRTNFSITESLETVEVTDYESLETREYETGFSGWTLSTEGHKEGKPPFDKGKQYHLVVWESDTAGQAFVGSGFYTSFNPSGSFNEAVKYPYTFQGTGYLHKPLA